MRNAVLRVLPKIFCSNSGIFLLKVGKTNFFPKTFLDKFYLKFSFCLMLKLTFLQLNGSLFSLAFDLRGTFQQKKLSRFFFAYESWPDENAKKTITTDRGFQTHDIQNNQLSFMHQRFNLKLSNLRKVFE